jgi:hypothetical protein
MRRHLKSAIALLAGIFCFQFTTIASANNNLFLPGDAFFPTTLTRDALEKLAEGKAPPIFEYSSFGGYDGAFCGYAGYRRATVAGIDDKFMANLQKAYHLIRKTEPRRLVERSIDGGTTLVETNGMRVLFYPKDFDFHEFKLGLQYNERWVNEAVKFGHSRKHLRLCALVDDPRAVELSWRDAAAVAELRVRLPNVDLKPLPPTDAPVTIQGDVLAVVLGGDDPLSAYFLPDDYTAELLVVDATGVVAYTFYDGQWNETPLDE